MEQYYYNHMNKQEQAAYHGILQGLSGLADEFQIPALDGETLYNVFFQLRLDHPEIFWATGYKYRYYKESPNIIFVPEYLFDKGKIKEHQKAMKSRVEKLVRPAKDMSEWEKEKYVHDFICQNVHYDKLKKAYSHEIIGPLGQGVGVCEGIAKAVKVLLDARKKVSNTVIPGTLSGSAGRIIIWMRLLIIHSETVIKSKIFVMIISILMTKVSSGIMSH